MELNEQQFITGFNSGYLLAKYEPVMLTSLLKDIRPTTSYIQGMTYGQREYEQELMKDRLNDLNELRGKGSREKNLERDI